MAKKKLAVIMDPIAAIAPEKDGTLGMLLEAQSRSYELTYFQQENLGSSMELLWVRAEI